MLGALSFVVASVGSAAEWTDLFDGKSLTGWVRRGGAAEYKVEDGAIVGETRPNTSNTFLCTEKMYGDFELELEFKVDDALNSGIQVRSNSVPGYQNGVVHGYQCEIDPSERAYTGGVYDESRRGVFLQDLSKNEAGRKALKHGQWNSYRIWCKGDRIQTWVNGVPCADLTDDMTKVGFIGLQVHGVGDRTSPLKVAWRKIRIRDLGVPYRGVPTGGQQLLGGDGDTMNWSRLGSSGGTPIGWKYRAGVAEVVPGTGNIESKPLVGDGWLYVKFMTDDNGLAGQANGNSGVYLQGSYEVQVLNSAGAGPAHDLCGGIYSIKAPDFAMTYPAYQWQDYLIRFIAPKWEGGKKVVNGRMSVWHNGTLIHRDVELPKETTAGQPETELPRGVMLQDHGNRVRYGTIWWRPL